MRPAIFLWSRIIFEIILITGEEGEELAGRSKNFEMGKKKLLGIFSMEYQVWSSTPIWVFWLYGGLYLQYLYAIL